MFIIRLILLSLLLVSHVSDCHNSAQDSTTVPNKLETSNTALLSLDCSCDDLLVTLDGDSVGVTPLQELSIKAGQHLLVVQGPFQLRWHTQNWQQSIHAVGGQHYRFKVSFPKMYIINTIPFGADVFANGKKLGVTPLTVFASPDSLVTIQVSKTNFKTKTLQLGENEEGEVRIYLEYMDGWLEQRNRKNLEHQKNLRWKRRGLYSSIAFSALAGLSTIYFRDRANEEYATYIRAGSPADMQHYYDRTKYYDKVAGISYTLFQIGFVFSGYFFLVSRGNNL
jgi:hypothetical protein